jgi:hypothetical protein
MAVKSDLTIHIKDNYIALSHRHFAKPRPIRNPYISGQIFARRAALEGWHYGFLTGRGLVASVRALVPSSYQLSDRSLLAIC